VFRTRFRATIVLVALAVFLVFPLTALAHGQTSVGDYDLEIGFHNEPVYQGQPNALDFFVTNSKTGERVNGLEGGLHAEIIFGSYKRELTVEPQGEVDGAYTAYVIPTEVGDYTWHIWGDIQGTPLDVSMTSSPDTFGSAISTTSMDFPGTEPLPADLQAQAASATRLATIGLIAGIAGVLLALVGLAFGLAGRRAARAR
jgi:hypothetical protein